jgi:uncharacterized protein YwgA
MFYRRKVILGLISLFNGELEKLRLQKLLFLFTQRQLRPVYDFVPYKYGCFSWSANADLTTMVKKGMVEETNSYFIYKGADAYLKQLKETDRKSLLDICNNYGSMDANSLMRHTYMNFPYWAINNGKAEQLLKPEYLNRVHEKRPT